MEPEGTIIQNIKVGLQAIPITPRHLLAQEDDGVEGHYIITLKALTPGLLLANAALDAFHTRVPVSIPGDFEYKVYDLDNGKMLAPYDEIESYSTSRYTISVTRADDESVRYESFHKMLARISSPGP